MARVNNLGQSKPVKEAKPKQGKPGRPKKGIVNAPDADRPRELARESSEPLPLAREDELAERRLRAADRVRTKVRNSDTGYTNNLGGNCESMQYFHGKSTG